MIATIDNAWTPVRYPGAVIDPDTGAWISDAEVAEIPYTALASTPDRITARLVVRRVNDARYRDALFAVWRYHPFFTKTDLPVDAADITHQGRDFAGFGDACCDRICDATSAVPLSEKFSVVCGRTGMRLLPGLVSVRTDREDPRHASFCFGCSSGRRRLRGPT